MERAQRRGYWFAAKVVRGAYMVSERGLAELDGYESPVHDALEDTHAGFRKHPPGYLFVMESALVALCTVVFWNSGRRYRYGCQQC